MPALDGPGTIPVPTSLQLRTVSASNHYRTSDHVTPRLAPLTRHSGLGKDVCASAVPNTSLSVCSVPEGIKQEESTGILSGRKVPLIQGLCGCLGTSSSQSLT